MNIAVYTALYGTIDRLWSVCPTAYDSDAEWFAFMDKDRQQVGVWGGKAPQIIDDGPAFPAWTPIIHEPRWDNRRTARHYKTMPHLYFPDADVWIWLDANVRLLIPPSEAVAQWLKGDLAIFKHPDRDCLFDEARFCAKVGKDDKRTLGKQTVAYSAAGMPARWGLPETRCVIRRNTAKMRALNVDWWSEIENRSLRDQVSIPYVCWRLGVKWGVIPGRAWVHNSSREFWFKKHKS